MIGTVSFIMDLSFVLKWLKALFCFVFVMGPDFLFEGHRAVIWVAVLHELRSNQRLILSESGPDLKSQALPCLEAVSHPQEPQFPLA